MDKDSTTAMDKAWAEWHRGIDEPPAVSLAFEKGFLAGAEYAAKKQTKPPAEFKEGEVVMLYVPGNAAGRKWVPAVYVDAGAYPGRKIRKLTATERGEGE